jgi:hypothetical protein
MDAGIKDPLKHIFVARADHIATLVMTRKPLTPSQLHVLHDRVKRDGFGVLIAPDTPSESPLINAIAASDSIAEINRTVASSPLDLSVPTDNRPFFFNQLRLGHLGWSLKAVQGPHSYSGGVVAGNLLATATLVLILALSIVAVLLTILLPLRSAARGSPRKLVVAGTGYFLLIGLGFMLGEIAILQYFSVYLGHPIYALGVCLFSLILATGLGSLLSSRIDIGRPRVVALWAALTAAYLFALQGFVERIFEATTAHDLAARIAISLALIMPLGLLLGFAFPTGMRLVKDIDEAPAPWFWGINGATGVLASSLAVMISMNFGINVTTIVAGLCYLCLIPFGRKLIGLRT